MWYERGVFRVSLCGMNVACSVYHRETLLGQLNVYIKQTRDDYMQRTSSGGQGAPKGKNLPETVNSILWVRQLEAKVRLLVCSFCQK